MKQCYYIHGYGSQVNICTTKVPSAPTNNFKVEYKELYPSSTKRYMDQGDFYCYANIWADSEEDAVNVFHQKKKDMLYRVAPEIKPKYKLIEEWEEGSWKR